MSGAETRRNLGLLVLAFAAFIFVRFVACDNSPSSQPRSAPTPTELPDLDASVGGEPGGMWIQNRTDDRWTNCNVSINEGLIRSGYELDVAEIDPLEKVSVSYFDFTKPDGARFDPAEVAVKDVWIHCDTPLGQQFASFSP